MKINKLKSIPLKLYSRTVEISTIDKLFYKKVDQVITSVGGKQTSHPFEDSIFRTYEVPVDVDLVELDEILSDIQTPRFSIIYEWEGWNNHPPEEKHIVDMWASRGYKYYPGYHNLHIAF